VVGSLSRWKRCERENARVYGVERTNTRYSCCRNGSRDSLNTYRMNVVTAGCGFSSSVVSAKVDGDVGLWYSSLRQPPLPNHYMYIYTHSCGSIIHEGSSSSVTLRCAAYYTNTSEYNGLISAG
jgi:hypothetical protein